MARPTAAIFHPAFPILMLVALLPALPLRATILTNSVPGSVSDGHAHIPYRLFEPQLNSPTDKVPLILFFHTDGDRGTDNVSQTYWMSNLQVHTAAGPDAAYVLAPQVAPGMTLASTGKKPSEAEKLIMLALNQSIADHAANIDTSRIYITGVSMGAKGVWDMLRLFPRLFAAAAPMSNGGDPSTAKIIKDIPIWAFHGSADPVIPVSRTRKMIAALRAAGGDPKYTEVAGAGHYIWFPIYNDPALYDWMFAQHQSAAAAAVAGGAMPSWVLKRGIAEPALARASGIAAGLAVVPEPVAPAGWAAILCYGCAKRRRRRRPPSISYYSPSAATRSTTPA
jgi:predicted esterase